MNEKGIYADNLLFSVDFPNIKHSKTIHPENLNVECAFVDWKDFTADDKKKMVSILYHLNEKTEGKYDKNKDKIVLTVTRDDAKTKEIFKKYFQEPYHYFKYTITIDCKKQKITISYPSVTYTKTFKEEEKTIRYNNGILAGTFQEKINKFLFENTIVLNDKLSNKITLGDVFTNNSYGVEKINTVQYEVNLTSVSYK